MCFEIVDPLTIKKVVDNKATYYANIDAIPEWTKPDQSENVPAISIWIDEAQALRKYEFQCAKSDKYTPLSGYEITEVRSEDIIETIVNALRSCASSCCHVRYVFC